MTIASLYPSIRPSLLLDFANTKQLDPRITFSRPTTATYYDGKTVAMAEQNLLLQSQALATGPWYSLRSTRTNNADTSPDGTTTATRLTQQTGQTTFGLVSQAISVAANATTSVFAKADGKNFLVIQTQGAGVLRTWFNLSTGAVGTTNANHTASIVSFGNDWYRCIVTSSQTGDGSTFYLADTDGASTVTDSGSILLWGAQLEQRSTVTAYTPTTTSAITNYIPALQTAVSNDARFDHDPVTGESKGLLIEEQRTNLVTYSEQFDNAAWGRSNTSIATNILIAPDGTLSVDKLVESATTAWHYASIPGTSITTQAYTFTIFAKAAERSVLQIVPNGAVFPIAYANFDLTTGTITANSGLTAYSATSVGNGWYRCSVTLTATLASNVAPFYVTIQNSTTAARAASYAGDGWSGLYLWGAQLEAGSFPTSYIPTVASQVTRSADSASMTGSNFSSWYRADEGTVYVESSTKAFASLLNYSALTISDNTTSNRIGIRASNNATNTNILIISSSATALTRTVADYSSSNRKFVVAYKSNDFAAGVDGGTLTTASSGAVPLSQDRIYIGAAATGSTELLNGTIKRIAFWPKRLSNSELQGLTS